MAVTKERFEQGLTYAEYKAQMTRNQDRFEENESAVEFSAEDLAFFRGLPQPTYVLAIGEDWCGDVIANLPVLGKLAEACDPLELRVFLRDENLDLIDQYLKEGQFRAIPVFAFFDANFNDLGHWIERPVRLTELREEMRQKLFATDPVLSTVDPETPIGQMSEAARARYMEANNAFREEHHALSNSEVVREIRAILESGTPQAAGTFAPAPVAASTKGSPARALGAQNGSANGSKSGRVKVSITYCAACGYEPQTLALTSALMHAFVHDLAAIELIPWEDGAFDVVVDGELVHSMYRDGGFPKDETIVQAVRERLA